MIGERIRLATGSAEEVAEEDNFFLLQRQGVAMAFRDSPVLGIGWGGFPKSRFSPTGHEVHSTPLRFLAELGLVGFALYLSLLGYLLIRSVQLFLAMRASRYGPVYLSLAVALWSLSVSWVYNRHITERTFAILLVVFLAMEHFATYRPSAELPAARSRRRRGMPLPRASPPAVTASNRIGPRLPPVQVRRPATGKRPGPEVCDS
jgi:hypothetical protein